MILQRSIVRGDRISLPSDTEVQPILWRELPLNILLNIRCSPVVKNKYHIRKVLNRGK